jgi:hypothetical protein
MVIFTQLFNRISQHKSVSAFLAHYPGKYGTNPIGCPSKKGQALKKLQASCGLGLSVICAGSLCTYATLVALQRL